MNNQQNAGNSSILNPDDFLTRDPTPFEIALVIYESLKRGGNTPQEAQDKLLAYIKVMKL